MTKQVIIGFALVALTVGALWPSIERTHELGRCAGGLVVLASLEEDELSWNPWNKNFYLIRPRTSEYLLRNFDFPYKCDDLGYWSMPPLHGVIYLRGLVDSSKTKEMRLLRILNELINRGLPINEYHKGYTPLFSAILTNDIQAVRALFDAQADPMLTVNTPGSKVHGMNAFEFADWLVTDSALPELNKEVAMVMSHYKETYETEHNSGAGK